MSGLSHTRVFAKWDYRRGVSGLPVITLLIVHFGKTCERVSNTLTLGQVGVLKRCDWATGNHFLKVHFGKTCEWSPHTLDYHKEPLSRWCEWTAGHHFS